MDQKISDERFNNFEDIPVTFGPLKLAVIMGISKNKAYDLVNTPDFPKIKVGRRTIICKDHFRKWLDSKMNHNE